MKRNILALGLCMALLFGLCAVPASAEETDWAAAYEQILNDWTVRISEEPVEYSAPELLIKTGTCEADYHGALYTFRDGRAFQVGEELGLGHCSFYSDPGENGIILMYGHMGYALAERISITDGFASETLYEDNVNERLQSDPDAEYVYPGDVIPGSVYLTLCRAEIRLPLTHYDEICRCLAGELPAVTEGSYPNDDRAFFDSLITANGTVYAVTADGYTNSPGWIGFRELLRQDVATDWMQGELEILSAALADCNGDGKLECVLSANNCGSEMRILLSEQDGVVYAYLMNYTDGYELDTAGNFVSTRYGVYRCRLIFDRDQAFLLTLANS